MTDEPQAEGLILYGVKAIARFLGIRDRQALHLIEQGRLPVFRSGRNVCAVREDVKAWAAEQAAAARRKPGAAG
ncbi:DNA-binding protein [Methylobacterium terricola]|uniref:DNA-binding protein n=1 Tax=Methylobacterium terricola TaxID=2583531 RepID=A0A5C4L5S6_9HYPH|nr:excisionase family DNA-binding protein [Methylobacterium terricola]TNC07094.1 DNA-binding protein [Methylobacterium terricola]